MNQPNESAALSPAQKRSGRVIPCETCEGPTGFDKEYGYSLLCCSEECEKPVRERIAKAICSHCGKNVCYERYSTSNTRVRLNSRWRWIVGEFEKSEHKECDECLPSRGMLCPGGCGGRPLYYEYGRVQVHPCPACAVIRANPNKCDGCRRDRSDLRGEGIGLRHRTEFRAKFCDTCFVSRRETRPLVDCPCHGGCGENVKRPRAVKGKGWCPRCESAISALDANRGRVADLLRRGGTEDAELLVTWFERVSGVAFNLAMLRGHPMGLEKREEAGEGA